MVYYFNYPYDAKYNFFKHIFFCCPMIKQRSFQKSNMVYVFDFFLNFSFIVVISLSIDVYKVFNDLFVCN